MCIFTKQDMMKLFCGLISLKIKSLMSPVEEVITAVTDNSDVLLTCVLCPFLFPF